MKLSTYDIILYRPILHRFANEDVSLGSWFIGLDVEHIDDRSLCCGTPPGMILHYVTSSRTHHLIFTGDVYLLTWTNENQ